MTAIDQLIEQAIEAAREQKRIHEEAEQAEREANAQRFAEICGAANAILNTLPADVLAELFPDLTAWENSTGSWDVVLKSTIANVDARFHNYNKKLILYWWVVNQNDFDDIQIRVPVTPLELGAFLARAQKRNADHLDKQRAFLLGSFKHLETEIRCGDADLADYQTFLAEHPQFHAAEYAETRAAIEAAVQYQAQRRREKEAQPQPVSVKVDYLRLAKNTYNALGNSTGDGQSIAMGLEAVTLALIGIGEELRWRNNL